MSTPYQYAAKAADQLRQDIVHCHWADQALVLPVDGPWVDQVRDALEAAYRAGLHAGQADVQMPLQKTGTE